MGQVYPAAVYFLCFATSSACAILLGRNYARTRARLLMWSAVCFTLLAANNLTVMLDLLVFPEHNLRLPRLAFSLSAVTVLIVGFIWDSKD